MPRLKEMVREGANNRRRQQQGNAPPLSSLALAEAPTLFATPVPSPVVLSPEELEQMQAEVAVWDPTYTWEATSPVNGKASGLYVLHIGQIPQGSPMSRDPPNRVVNHRQLNATIRGHRGGAPSGRGRARRRLNPPEEAREVESYPPRLDEARAGGARGCPHGTGSCRGRGSRGQRNGCGISSTGFTSDFDRMPSSWESLAIL
jgi:hypothetical protein